MLADNERAAKKGNSLTYYIAYSISPPPSPPGPKQSSYRQYQLNGNYYRSGPPQDIYHASDPQSTQLA